MAKRLVTAAPPPAPVDEEVRPYFVTPRDLARALHAVENDGRVSRFGTGVCGHQAQAERVLMYLSREVS